VSISENKLVFSGGCAELDTGYGTEYEKLK
jgi:hypothetical protein